MTAHAEITATAGTAEKRGNKMSQQIGLPEHISEIHSGFLSGKHYIGNVDVSHCTNIQISFNDGEWKIHAEFRMDKEGNTCVSKKTYRRGEYGLKEIPAADQTADNV